MFIVHADYKCGAQSVNLSFDVSQTFTHLRGHDLPQCSHSLLNAELFSNWLDASHHQPHLAHFTPSLAWDNVPVFNAVYAHCSAAVLMKNKWALQRPTQGHHGCRLYCRGVSTGSPGAEVLPSTLYITQSQ